MVGHLPKVECLPTLSLGDNTTFVQLTEVRCWVATLYQLADGNAKAGFGWNLGCWMEVAECPHTMGPTLGTNFFAMGFTSPLMGDGSCTGPMVNVD